MGEKIFNITVFSSFPDIVKNFQCSSRGLLKIFNGLIWTDVHFLIMISLFMIFSVMVTGKNIPGRSYYSM